MSVWVLSYGVIVLRYNGMRARGRAVSYGIEKLYIHTIMTSLMMIMTSQMMIMTSRMMKMTSRMTTMFSIMTSMMMIMVM